MDHLGPDFTAPRNVNVMWMPVEACGSLWMPVEACGCWLFKWLTTLAILSALESQLVTLMVERGYRSSASEKLHPFLLF